MNAFGRQRFWNQDSRLPTVRLLRLQRRIDAPQQSVHCRAAHVAGRVQFGHAGRTDQQAVGGVSQRQACVPPTIHTLPVLGDHKVPGIIIEGVAGQQQPVRAGSAAVAVGGAVAAVHGVGALIEVRQKPHLALRLTRRHHHC
jgi:hypothetical protein